MVIGFFMPLPLAMMIPFMGIQSMVMAKQFGENFQYGKRRISAMSNDEFNKLTPAKLLSNANAELQSQIPLMKESMQDMREFQTFIVKEFLLTIRAIIDAGLGKLIGLTPTEINDTVQNIEHFIHGHFEGHGASTSPGPGGSFTPGVNPNQPLLNISASAVGGLSNLKLFDIVENKFHLYDVPSQIRLRQFYDIRIKGTKTKPPDIEPGIPLEKVGFDGVLALITDAQWNGLRSNLWKKKLQATKNYQEWQSIINSYYAQIRKAWQTAGGSLGPQPGKTTSWNAMNKIKKSIEQLIVFVNSKVSIPN